ncbi:MAG: zinc-dependent peptidase [Amphiplicatus sp.]|nr:zinc-dependent peptidase [Amphiplicatus sp.]MCB9955884.1 zinc-dependent peptidase [Caulobacterales bacterium]
MSTGLLLLIAALALAGLAWFIRREMKKRRRARLRAMRLSPEERAGLAQEMPVYARLPEETRALLDGLVHQFLAEIRIYGAGELEVTEEMKRLIAAQACLLLVGRPERWYHSLRTIHLYPAGFQSRMQEREGYVVTERAQGRLGESWRYGPVILSWRDAAQGAANPRDGRNVVYHEFAHQLDSETGVVDGAPLLDETQSAGKWARVMQSAYDGLRSDVVQGDAHFLDPYGATSPAEFFAVATEQFFEQPDAMRRALPALFRELSEYFNVDPSAWT